MESRRIEFSTLNLSAQDLKAGGTLLIDAKGVVSGRLGIEAKSGGARRTAKLRITGTLSAPNYQR